jgi:hypothetical protein
LEQPRLPLSDQGRFGGSSPEPTKPLIGRFSQRRGQYAFQGEPFQPIQGISTSEAESDSNFLSLHGCDGNKVICNDEEEDSDNLDPDEEDHCLADDEGCDFPDSQDEGSAFPTAVEAIHHRMKSHK